MSDETWYTITVVQHTGYPNRVSDSKPTDVIACTLLPSMAGTVLRGIADEIAPKKPVMRGAPDKDWLKTDHEARP